MQPHVLVTGATGRLGQLLVPRLLARGARVRALTRSAERAEGFRAQQVDVVVGGFEDADALRHASEGVSHLFLLSPITPTLAAQQIAAIEAAKAAGVQRIVKLSGSHWTLAPPGRSLSGDAHAEVEAALARTGIAHRVLRPNAWTQVMLARLAAEIAGGDILHAPHGEARTAYIDTRDIADVAVAALLDAAPPGLDGPWVLTGSRAVDHAELARIASRITGRTIVAQPLSAQQRLARQRDSGLPPFIERVHAQFAKLIGAGEAEPVTETVARVLGRAPRTIESFLEETLARRN